MGYRLLTTINTAASGTLASLADAKAELSLTSGDQDAIVSRYLAASTAAIEQFCNRTFGVQGITDEFWPDRESHAYQVTPGISEIIVSQWPIVAVETVTENGDTLDDGTDYRVDYRVGKVIRLNEQPYPTFWRAWPISIKYTGGYATIPADVQDACIRLVKARYLAKDRDPFLRSESIPGVRDASWWIATGSDAGNMPPDVQDILENYRQPVVIS